MFKDRLEAGYILSEKTKIPDNSVIFSIPRGGIPVGFAISESKKVPFDVVSHMVLYKGYEKHI
jgi:predicted phosphoribosyltransferase